MTLSRYGVLGADLGYPIVYPDKIVLLFGDTLGVYTDASMKYYLTPGSGGNDSIGYIPNVDPSQCHYISAVDHALSQGLSKPSVSTAGCPAIHFYEDPQRGSTDHIFKTTTISGLNSGEDLGPFRTPSGAFDYNGSLYMFYIVDAQSATPHFALESILAKADQPAANWSDTNPPTFTRLYTVSTHPAVADPNNPPPEANDYGKFMFDPVVPLNAATLSEAGITPNLPPSLQNAEEVVFVFGSSWQYDRSNLYLAAFSAADVEAGTTKWFYYAGQSNGTATWTTDEKSAAALLSDPADIGNHSVVWNEALHKFVLMANHVTARFSATPWGPWSDPILVFGPQSEWATKLIHHPGVDPITRSLVTIYNPNTGEVADLNSNDPGVPYGPYLIDKYTQNTDGSVNLFYTMSTWNPYEVFLVSSTFQVGVHGGSIVSSADYAPDAIAPGSIATILAAGLSDRAFAASSPDLTTSLGGTSVDVTDSAGVTRAAGLYYVGPSQINFLIPDASATGAATVMVTQGSTTVLSLATTISSVAPALYSIDGTGTGAAAGFLYTVDSNNNTTIQPLFACGSAGCTTNPVDVGNAQLAFLALFGTGIRHASSHSSVTATIGGLPATIIYAGPQNTYPGLDQVNVQVPSGVRGMGVVNVAVGVDGQASNVLQADFK
jgi:uncharacterized protein (TIGR03437 family)